MTTVVLPHPENIPLHIVDFSTNNEYTPSHSLLNSLYKFYSEPQNILQLYNFISGEDKISLRLLEWTVINYAKYEGLVINNKDSNSVLFVHSNYKSALDGYSKKQFDPCCRTERIQIPYKNKFLKTTVAQMNFIRWAIESNILDYIRENYTMLIKDMKLKNKTKKNMPNSSDATKKDIKTRKRRGDVLPQGNNNTFTIVDRPVTLKCSI